MEKKLGSSLLATLILASITLPTVLACTTLTPGYWKNHIEAWPTSGTIYIGTDEYDLSLTSDVDYLMDILWEDPGHWKKVGGKLAQAWLILVHKVIAAQLSMLSYPHDGWGDYWLFGDYPDGMEGMVNDANEWLQNYPSVDRDSGIALAETIDYWLNYWNEHGL